MYRDSVVGTATGYGLDGRNVGSSNASRGKICVLSTPRRPALRSSKPPIQYVTGAFIPGVKRPRREGNQLPPNSGEVKEPG
jgi:hypothetical protein